MRTNLKNTKSDTTRLERLGHLPESVQLESLVPWKDVTVMCGGRDVEHTRRLFRKAKVPLVQVSERKELPRLRTVLDLLASRERKGDA